MNREVSPEDFNYVLPPELIAHEPAVKRDSSRLLVYDTRSNKVSFDTFDHLSSYLPNNSVLILNDTKVVPARLKARKDTGGNVELLLLVNEWLSGQPLVRSLANRKLSVGQRVHVDAELWFEVVGQEEHIFLLKPSVSRERLFTLLETQGLMPVPHYLQPVPLTEEATRERYQSIFARQEASIAAPTASLHFTPAVLEDVEKKGVEKAFVTLHVGLGTFAPVTARHLQTKKLHQELAQITPHTAEQLNAWKAGHKRFIAVGTTAARVLESRTHNGVIQAGSDFTELFITPGYHFGAVDGLITNFHLPKSSLMMLVQALLEDKHAQRTLKELYMMAIEEKFRFYSFGDAMLIV
jgi:S-adenosylmethionine:tRNA ribosyltransferase-isomerase